MKPPKVFLFLLACLGILGIIAFSFPKEGVFVFGKKFRFVPLSEIFSVDSTQAIDVEKLLAKREDSLKAAFKALQKSDSLVIKTNDPLHLQYNDSLPNALDKFFEALQHSRSAQVRIIHYGDSQIEEDRISNYIRSKLQARFGGGGIGLLSVKNITNSLSVTQSSSENWQRYTAFGTPDTTNNGRYGAMAIVCKMNVKSKDSLDTLSTKKVLHTGSMSYTFRSGNVGRFSKLKIYLGHLSDSAKVKISYAGISETKAIGPSAGLKIMEFNLSQSPRTLSIQVSSFANPEIYGLSMEQAAGIIVDNIPMRGCSGTMFGKLSYGLSQQMYQDLSPALFIMQFGGNTIPYIQSKAEAAQYARYFKANMQRIKSMNPNASFIVVGPSDMSTKIDGKMQTYPILPDVRNEMKKVAFEFGAAYFDLYEVMGGKNSMPNWVDAVPALAAKDYIHFSPQGAKRIAELFYEAISLDYEAFLIRTGKKKKKK